jgi:hypothetical protein
MPEAVLARVLGFPILAEVEFHRQRWCVGRDSLLVVLLDGSAIRGLVGAGYSSGRGAGGIERGGFAGDDG